VSGDGEKRDWREDYCSRAQYQITGSRLVVWYEKADGGGTLFGLWFQDRRTRNLQGLD